MKGVHDVHVQSTSQTSCDGDHIHILLHRDQEPLPCSWPMVPTLLLWFYLLCHILNHKS